MKLKFKKIIIGLFCISSLANAENPPKYEIYIKNLKFSINFKIILIYIEKKAVKLEGMWIIYKTYQIKVKNI